MQRVTHYHTVKNVNLIKSSLSMLYQANISLKFQENIEEISHQSPYILAMHVSHACQPCMSAMHVSHACPLTIPIYMETFLQDFFVILLIDQKKCFLCTTCVVVSLAG